MFHHLRVAVVVPAFNEEAKLRAMLAEIPDCVDRVFVVDDASMDMTAVIADTAGGRVEVIRHRKNRGVGAAVITGYRRALQCSVDAVVVMAGDGQMDPDDLPRLLEPLARGQADYVKGNRFAHRDVWREMPAARIVGNALLSYATKLSSGHWRVFDSQCGYTAISRAALLAVDLARVFPRYGYPNDLLARLRTAGARVVDVPVRPVYGATWSSGVRWYTAIYPIGYVLSRSWIERMRVRWTRGLGGDDPCASGL